MAYVLHITTLIALYAVLALSLNLVAGYTGLLSMAQAAFYGVGAYTAALLCQSLNVPFIVVLLCAAIVSMMAGAIVSFPSLRLHDDYFMIATFAAQVIVFSLMNNLVSFTGGPMGLPGIPRPVIMGWRLSSDSEFLALVVLYTAFSFWVCWLLVRSPFGRLLKALREDEVLVQARGKRVACSKVLVFMVSAGLAAGVGVLYAQYMSFIDPTSFTVMESVFIISIVIAGGAGSLWGPLVGAAVLVIMPEGLRFLGLPSSVAADIRQILYGVLLVAFMLWRPQGLIGDYTFDKGGSGREGDSASG